jgi:predicted SnoaL-like aldol condensation-catalyzing enzyme
VQNSPTDLGQAVDDVYRVAKGKIVEHWNVVQNVPATSANNNTMF